MSVVHGRGRLTDGDRDRIHELAEKGWKASAIAREIKRHPATVNWFMYRHGYQAPKYHENRPRSYVRNGRIVRAFSPEEDAFITALRVQDFGFTEIARLTNLRFGTERSFHTVHCRLVMLASREERP